MGECADCKANSDNDSTVTWVDNSTARCDRCRAIRADERAKIVEAGRAWVANKVDSAFSTAHLANFLDAIERGEHRPKPGQPKEGE